MTVRNGFIHLVLVCMMVFGFSPVALAVVSRVEFNPPKLLEEGMSFGETGPYEEITGRVYFTIDPLNATNQVIADLDLAPVNANGQVEFSADIVIQRPVIEGIGNGVTLLDIPNRGTRITPLLNKPTMQNVYGDGFLMSQGYTLVWVGWEYDLPNRQSLRIQAPNARGTESPIAGLGFAAVRDTVSWIKNNEDSPAFSEYVIGFGLSQSGRFLRNYLYLGFNTDEAGRRVFDGMIPHIAGASRIDLNRRDSQPASQGQFTATAFPFADNAMQDPVSGITDGLLENYRAEQNQPKIFYTNTPVEYWGGGRVAALTHTTPDGTQDIELQDNVRMYFLAGAQHVPGAFPVTRPTTTQEPRNPLDYWWTMRALVTAMKNWVVSNTEPPASAYPRLDDRTLVLASELAFPANMGVHNPRGLTAGTRVANPIFRNGAGGGAELPLLVPQVNTDGNEISGIRHPELIVPLATYTGWNFTNEKEGDPDTLFPLAGSYIPFNTTAFERNVRNDLRRAIQERYPNKLEYLQRVREAARIQVSEGYLLARDLPRLLVRASLHWDVVTAD